jgi:flagellar biosynthesis protein FliP
MTARWLVLLLLLVPGLGAVEPPSLDLPPGAVEADLIGDARTGDLASDTAVAPGAGGAVLSGAPGAAGGLTVRIEAPAGGDYSSAVTILLVITALSVAPAFLMMMTCFTRVIIVLGFLRRALGTQTLPPNQVMLGLALFLSIFIMAPTLRQVNDQALQPWMAKTITQDVALVRAETVVKGFMLQHTRKNDLALFIRLAGDERPATAADVRLTTLVPAFATSELRTAFQMGFVIFLPFLVIDLVVSAILMAMGMMMLPPVVVSLPFKLLLFVLVDGWTLLVSSLVASYR